MPLRSSFTVLVSVSKPTEVGPGCRTGPEERAIPAAEIPLGKRDLLVLKLVLVSSLLLEGVILAQETEAPSVPSEFTFTVRDEAGGPVAGIQVGAASLPESGAIQGHYIPVPEKRTGKQVLVLGGDKRGPAVVTDEAGQVHIARNYLFQERSNRPRALMAATDNRELIGYVMLRPDQTESEVDIVLQKTCRLTVHATCPFLEARGQPTTELLVAARLNQVAFCVQQSPTAENTLPLPTGEFELWVMATDTDHVSQNVTIEAGEQTKDVEVELPPTRVAELTGQPAPELQQIKAWRGGDPVTLKELRGQIVLLDFWGWWCVPCREAMPELFELHDRYQDMGLVIIAVHDASVADLAELDEKLTDIRKEWWDGRDIPFRVAIDGRVKGGGRSRSVTTDAYGIAGWPTCVLIDRKGIVRGQVQPSKDEDRELIDRLVREGAVDE